MKSSLQHILLITLFFQPTQTKILEVVGTQYLSNFDGIDSIVGKGPDAKIILTSDVQIDQNLKLEKITIHGINPEIKNSRNKDMVAKHGISTTSNGKVDFGPGVILKDCTVRKLK